MVKEIYISVDIESDGPIPKLYSMTALGAVVAGSQTANNEYEAYDVTAPTNRFYSELKPISYNWNPEAMRIGLFEGFDAEAAKEDPTGEARRAYILENGIDPLIEMTRFAKWVEDKKIEYNAKAAVFAGYPLGFDWMWTYWYLIMYSETGSPFGHSRHIDIKTLYAEKAHVPIMHSNKRNIPKSLHSNLPHTHLAVQDAAEQGELLMNILRWEGK